MSTAQLSRSSGGGTAFLVSAGVVYEILSATNSSPQTTEINADTRAATLMKWVNLGLGQAAGFVAIAAWIDPAHRNVIIYGGLAAGILMWLQYDHAKRVGLKNGGPGTEH